MAKLKSKSSKVPAKKKPAVQKTAGANLATGIAPSKKKAAPPTAVRKTKSIQPEIIEPEILEPEAIVPELVESATGGRYDPDELRAELESMREVGIDPERLIDDGEATAGADDDVDDESDFEDDRTPELDGRPQLRPARTGPGAKRRRVPN